MDIWQWVEELGDTLNENGQEHVAQLLYELPAAAHETDPRTEAMVSQLMAAAKTMDMPWLEVYTRHWHLQYLVDTRADAPELLNYAVGALEKAHRPETEGCPQAVCTTQDISFMYEAVDAVGYGQEREDVCRETLLRVTPEWSCYDCLSRELSEALIDQGKNDEALEVITNSIAEMVAAGEVPAPSYASLRARQANAAGNYAEALEFCEKGEQNPDEQKRARLSRHLEQATALRGLGRADEALQWLPSPAEIRPQRATSSRWAQEAFELVRSGALDNTSQLGSALQSMFDHVHAVGAVRAVVDIGRVHGVLAAERGVLWVAESALKSMESALPELRDDHGAGAVVAEVRAACADVEHVEMPCAAADLLATLPQLEASPEIAISWMRTAGEERPEDVELAHMLTIAYLHSGNTALLLEFTGSLADHPITLDQRFRDVVQVLVSSAAEPTEIKEVVDAVRDNLLARNDDAASIAAHRIEAEFHWRTGDPKETLEACTRALQIAPKEPQLLHLAGLASIKVHAFETAVEHFKAFNEVEPQGADWDLITAATCLEDWETVRAAAGRLDLKLPGKEGPIEGDFGWHTAVLTTPFGRRGIAVHQTGPASARVVEVTHPNEGEQLFGKRVVLDSPPINIDDREDEGDEWRPIFAIAHITNGDPFQTQVIDGVFPGEKVWPDTLDFLRSKGWGAWAANWPEYELTNPEDSESKLPGIYVFLAVPEGLPADTIDEVLKEATASWEHTPIWPNILDDLSEKRQAEQRAIAIRYGISN